MTIRVSSVGIVQSTRDVWRVYSFGRLIGHLLDTGTDFVVRLISGTEDTFRTWIAAEAWLRDVGDLELARRVRCMEERAELRALAEEIWNAVETKKWRQPS